MRSMTTRMLLAAAVAVISPGGATRADELRFSDIENRLGVLEKKVGIRHQTRQASFLAGSQEPIPGEEAMPGEEALSGEEAACSEASGYDCNNGCGQSCGQEKCRCAGDFARYYAEAQVMWLRVHLNEDAVGKLSEQYEITPRFILGYEDAGGLGGRLRYWHYDHRMLNLDTSEVIRFGFEVIDAEATNRLRTRRTELVLAGGLRWADLEIENGDIVWNQMPGITFAADLRSVLCRSCRREWAGVAGARWSILGGDWEGEGIVDAARDDNVVVHEIYGGFEHRYRTASCELFARAVMEVQNWHSDVLGQDADMDSLGFFGPGVHIGANF